VIILKIRGHLFDHHRGLHSITFFVLKHY